VFSPQTIVGQKIIVFRKNSKQFLISVKVIINNFLRACSLYSSLVAIFVSAGASGIPSAGLSYTILCLEAVGVPTRFIGLIFAIDWIV
jgi:Na+/H+-dicarboxylate symporter